MSAKSEQKQEIRILEFKSKYARDFRDINHEWLEEFFEVEPYDQIVLNDPHGQIIAHGGCVLLAALADQIIGTCALLKHTERKYELAKMGVLKDFRGRGVGRKLTEAAIAKARSLGADTLVLATNRNLEAANRLYKNMGFREVDLSEIGPLPYKRPSIVMKLQLTSQ